MGTRYFANRLQDYNGTASEQEVLLQCNGVLLEQIGAVVELIGSNIKPEPKLEDGGLYVGLSGISYALHTASQCHQLSDEVREQCSLMSENYLNCSLEYCRRKSEARNCIGSSFLLGHLGVYAFAAVFYHSKDNSEKSQHYLDKFISLHKMCTPLNFLECGGDELLVGRAGYLCGVLYLQEHLGKDVIPAAVIQTLVKSIVASGRKCAKKLKCTSPLMYTYYDAKYLGAAHGLSSILQMLMSFPLSADVRDDVRAASYSLLSCETEGNNYPPVLGESGEGPYHWCHGGPGVIYFLIKAFNTFQDPSFIQAALRAGGDTLWQKGLLRKGPGICHGVSGSGYAFLALYRVTNEVRYLHRAVEFAQFIFRKEFEQARVPDCPFSLYEGWAGTLCYLVDLLQPNQSYFPFFNVFQCGCHP